MSVTPTSRGRLARGGRDYAPLISNQLRAEILAGRLAAGSRISQAQIAADFGVSRGPVREAFRLLESEGLLVARANLRAQVTDLSVDELEHLYTLRVVNESLALSVSMASFTIDELDELAELAELLTRTTDGSFDFDDWDAVHQRFHTLLLSHSGPNMLRSVADWSARTQRYRRAYADEGRGLTHGAAEHAVLAQLCRDRDEQQAARLLALHLARAALTLVSQMEPTHEPVLLRAAIRQAVGQG